MGAVTADGKMMVEICGGSGGRKGLTMGMAQQQEHGGREARAAAIGKTRSDVSKPGERVWV